MARKKKNGNGDDSWIPKYKEGFPLTGNKPPSYSFDVYDKAVKRDSTQLSSNWGWFTSRPGIENVLQINREYRDKAAQILQQNTPTEYRGGGKMEQRGPIQSLENGGVIQHD
jgi:hypothetical protein